MNNRYVLVLASLNPDRTDLSGTKFPTRGFVESKRYKPDANIMAGLYGTLWGRTENSRWMNPDRDAAWLVIRCEQNDEIISLDKESNLVKFRAGMVVFDGCRADCYRYIDDNTPEELRDALAQAGRVQVEPNENNHLLLHGLDSRAVTEKANAHAINAGERGYARASGFASHAVALSKGGEATATGEEGCAFATSRNTRVSSMGHSTVAVSAGDGSMVAVGKSSIAAGLGSGSEGMAGEEGVLILAYFDGLRRRVKVGYVGENIEPNTLYRLSEAGEFEKMTNS